MVAWPLSRLMLCSLAFQSCAMSNLNRYLMIDACPDGDLWRSEAQWLWRAAAL